MAQTISTSTSEAWGPFPTPDVSHIVTEDDTPLDNIFSEKQQRLLTTSLYSSLQLDKPFLATANVGLFYTEKKPPLVPDVLLSLEVSVPQDWSEKKDRSYFLWNFSKPPEVAIEVVSNTVGNELGSKLRDYANACVAYYVVYDPLNCLSSEKLLVHELRGNSYELLDKTWLESINLGLILWEGKFEDKEDTWLRWCDRSGQILLTGDERAEVERQRAEVERQRAEVEHQKAEVERQRAERLAARLRELGIDPEKE